MENSYSVLDKDPDLRSVKAYIYSTCKKLTSIKSTITKHLTTLRFVISVVSELRFYLTVKNAISTVEKNYILTTKLFTYEMAQA